MTSSDEGVRRSGSVKDYVDHNRSIRVSDGSQQDQQQQQ